MLKLLVIVLTAAVLLNWVRGESTFPIIQVLPFLGGSRSDFGEWTLVAMAAVMAWGLVRLAAKR